MKKLTIWDGESNIIMANGTLRTADEVRERYPFTQYETTVLERNGNAVMTQAINSLETLKTIFKVETEDETQALGELQAIINAEPAE